MLDPSAIVFVENRSQVVENNAEDIDIATEIREIKRMSDDIERHKGIPESRRADIKSALNRAVLPEFDRLEVASAKSGVEMKKFIKSELTDLEARLAKLINAKQEPN